MKIPARCSNLLFGGMLSILMVTIISDTVVLIVLSNRRTIDRVWTPTLPQSYRMGKCQLAAIIEEYQRRCPDAGMKRMHDEILQCGSPPPPD